MITKPESPREWWIWPSLEFGLPAWHCGNTPPLKRDDKDVHVIEYSAYEALLKENEKLKAEREPRNEWNDMASGMVKFCRGIFTEGD